MKIAFITDLHLPISGEKARGVDTFLNLNNILKDLKLRMADFIIIGGDLSLREPDPAANFHVRELLEKSNIPYVVVPGNHDDPAQLKNCFSYPHEMDELYYVKQLGDIPCIFLDSSSGELSHTQLNWMDDLLDKRSEITNIFVHHPIVISNAVYMDNNYALSNITDIQNILNRYDRNFKIFSGHYHIEKTIYAGNITQFITPSLYIQIDQSSAEFKIDHHTPGYRIIQFQDDQLFTYVRYIWE